MASATEIITLARNIADRHGLDETLVCAVRHAGKTLVKIGTAAYPDTTAASVQQT
jgi:heterodisulfide reductase subunit C